ncbi:hypothetical protein OHA72_57205 [Dactylosporangium sp. NBC_01737]|uniref:hypothetical protein n=1 Tax=Dactylosporangium sp. NBC_01737 TaxID=2975959 RepID=UPI002E0F2297|nr:hypothetical protein OHA72_57205 [Dactylosporangium sp. NBC_01737]
MRKTLAFEQPLAYGFLFYAAPLGILAARPKATDWVLSNYVQVVYEHSGEAAPVPFAFYVHDYSVSPWLETLRLNRDWVSRQDRGIAGIVRDAIELDFYVYLGLNERYVPERLAYGRNDYPHENLIRGVDDRDDCFELYGWDQHQVFRATQLPQDDLPIAYHNNGSGPFYDVPLTLYRYNDAGEYTFDLKYVERGVIEYLESFNTSTHFQAQRDPWDRAYGLETYNLLESYLDGYAAGREEYNPRNVHVLWEHKRLMVARLSRCAELVPAVGDLVEPYRQVERMARALRMMTIAHAEGHGTDFRAEAIALLRSIRAQDERLLRRFAACLADAREAVA